MKLRHLMWSTTTAACVIAATANLALARNPNCSGGILYVTQGDRDKQKGDLESWKSQMIKAVQRLEQCVAEDPNEFESYGYLGWAYAELDSGCRAGAAFDKAIQGLTAKGDRKKAEWATNNRESYWARTFNAGIGSINDAQNAYPEFTKKPADDAETTLKGEAEKHYRAALASLGSASCLKPNDPKTIRNLGSVHAFMGDYARAQGVFEDGLKAIPGDSSLTEALRLVRVNVARNLVDDKKYDEAITFFADLIKGEPNNADHQLSLASAYFSRAQTKDGQARAADFALAGDHYAKAAELKPNDPDLPYNAGLAYQNAANWAKSEAMWRAAAKLRPDDTDILGALGSVLAEQKKYDEAIKTVHQAVQKNPQSKGLHRQLGNIYTKAGNNNKATEELMVYLALEKGQAVADAAGTAKGAREGSAAAKTLATDGAPEQVTKWSADAEGNYETWFYWARHRAYTFKGGSLVTRSDWSAADAGSAGRK